MPIFHTIYDISVRIKNVQENEMRCVHLSGSKSLSIDGMSQYLILQWNEMGFGRNVLLDAYVIALR